MDWQSSHCANSGLWGQQEVTEAVEEALDADEDMAEVAILNYDDLDSVAKLQKSQRYHDIMKVYLLKSVLVLIPWIWKFSCSGLHCVQC